jgi:hypothetical protein
MLCSPSPIGGSLDVDFSAERRESWSLAMRFMRRVLRWRATNYWQVWLVDAAGYGLAVFVVWAILGHPLAGLVPAVIGLITRGAIQTYRLDRRMDRAAGVPSGR